MEAHIAAPTAANPNRRFLAIAENLPPLLAFAAPVVALRVPVPISHDFGVLRRLPSFRSAIQAGILNISQIAVFEIELFIIFILCTIFTYKYGYYFNIERIERKKRKKLAIDKNLKLKYFVLAFCFILFGTFMPYNENFDPIGIKYKYLVMNSFSWSIVIIFTACCLYFDVGASRSATIEQTAPAAMGVDDSPP